MREGSRLRLLTSALMFAAAFCIGDNLYKKFEGHLLLGSELQISVPLSLVTCAAMCKSYRPECRAFNVRKNSKNCSLMTSFSALSENAAYDLYFDRDMYQELGYVKFRGGLLYYPPPNAPHITWWMLYGECLKHWGTIFVPEDMTDWAWMQDVAWSFQGTWVPLSEQKTDEGNYVWSGPVQGISVTIQDDGGLTEAVQSVTEDGFKIYENYVDCGLIPNPPAGTDIIIVDCNVYYPGFICKAGIPDTEAVAIHPEL